MSVEAEMATVAKLLCAQQKVEELILLLHDVCNDTSHDWHVRYFTLAAVRDLAQTKTDLDRAAHVITEPAAKKDPAEAG